MVRRSFFISISVVLIIMKCCLAVAGVRLQAKAGLVSPLSSSTPPPTITTPTQPPPEGNTTFLDGTPWCVALPGVSQDDLQNALDWTCGQGKTDCGAISSGGPCYQPDTLLSHASFAFNSYYQQNGNSDIACNFGGTATLTKRDPSYGKCLYAASGNSVSSATRRLALGPIVTWYRWTVNVSVFLLLYMRR